jgi:hypothetical protein
MESGIFTWMYVEFSGDSSITTSDTSKYVPTWTFLHSASKPSTTGRDRERRKGHTAIDTKGRWPASSLMSACVSPKLWFKDREKWWVEGSTASHGGVDSCLSWGYHAFDREYP